jgi:protein TonB
MSMILALLLATASSAPQAQGAAHVPTPSPIGDPLTWFPSESYPPAAKAAGAEGRTVFSVDVDVQGRVTSCNILQSSGTPILDSTTCALVVTNGRFEPATDGSGKPVSGVWKSAMRWQLSAPLPSEDDGVPL